MMPMSHPAWGLIQSNEMSSNFGNKHKNDYSVYFAPSKKHTFSGVHERYLNLAPKASYEK